MADDLLDRARRAAVSPNYWPSGDLGEILVALIARLDAAEREVERLREWVETAVCGECGCHPSNPEWRPCRQVYISDERRHELADLLEQFDRSHQ